MNRFERPSQLQAGDLLALPFPDSGFDVVWTQHVVMNIPDRERVYREFRRVLRPGGKLVFYDALATDAKPELHFPVPSRPGRAVISRNIFRPRPGLREHRNAASAL